MRFGNVSTATRDLPILMLRYSCTTFLLKTWRQIRGCRKKKSLEIYGGTRVNNTRAQTESFTSRHRDITRYYVTLLQYSTTVRT